ncbi:MAG: hypothetical protein LBF12_04335 [Christensenellaceae bacterium]|jgi:uncharacterized membrane protein YccF (DUF307 family)|nr:hypothetical protein [Christensenellaceae bacterium]
MKTIGNILWIIFAGFFMWLGILLVGLLLCITIIGIPYGKQLFNLAFFMLMPFGRRASANFGKNPIANLIWVILVGWGAVINLLFATVILVIFIITIPFAKQTWKLIPVVAFPFGAKFS